MHAALLYNVHRYHAVHSYAEKTGWPLGEAAYLQIQPPRAAGMSMLAEVVRYDRQIGAAVGLRNKSL